MGDALPLGLNTGEALQVILIFPFISQDLWFIHLWLFIISSRPDLLTILNLTFRLSARERYLASLKWVVIEDTAVDISILERNEEITGNEEVKINIPIVTADKSSRTVSPLLFFIFKYFFYQLCPEVFNNSQIFNIKIIN